MFYRKYAILQCKWRHCRHYIFDMTINRQAAKNNRKVTLDGIDKIPGEDLDEYPPSMSREGGKGSSVLDERNGR